MGNVNGRASKKGAEITEKLGLNNERSPGSPTPAAGSPKRWRGKKLEEIDEEMINQVYEVLKTAGKEGSSHDIQYLRRYVREQLRNDKKCKAVLDELGNDCSDSMSTSNKQAAPEPKFKRSTTAVSA